MQKQIEIRDENLKEFGQLLNELQQVVVNFCDLDANPKEQVKMAEKHKEEMSEMRKKARESMSERMDHIRTGSHNKSKTLAP